MMFPKIKTWRSEKHRRLVATIPCLKCGNPAVQVCHANATKGMSIKASDVLTFPLCVHHHAEHDRSGQLEKQERWRTEWELVDRTRSILIQRNQWNNEAETQYQIAIEPIARVVHPEVA